MKVYSADRIYNVALVGHQGAGKTTLAEAALFCTGAIDRQGRVNEGNTRTDFDPEEQRRGISINLALAPVEHDDLKFNLIDIPGYLDFQGELASGLRAADLAVIVLNGPSGVEVGAEIAAEMAAARSLPRFIFVNKMDREHADFDRVMQNIRAVFGNRCAAVQVPIGAEGNFRGVVDVLHRTAWVGSGRNVSHGEVPSECVDRVEECREALMESAAEANDELLEKYLGGELLTDEELVGGLLQGVRDGNVIPVLFGSAENATGIQAFFAALRAMAPSAAESGARPDAPVSLIVFKTLSDPYVGKLSYYRVLSGVMRGGADLQNVTRDGHERFGQVFYLRGKTQEPAERIPAGDLGAVAKLVHAQTGDLLGEPGAADGVEGIEFPAPVYSLAISANSKADEDKMGPALGRISEEDPTFHFRRDPETGQTVISGLGDTHLNIAIERLARLQAHVTPSPVKVAYRETIHSTVRVQGRHKKQTGGRGQFGDCWVQFEPLPRGSGYEFVDKIVGGSIPRQYIPAVDKGLQEAMHHGILGGFPVVDIRAICDDGSYHDVDSSEMAFRQAAHLAFRTGMERAAPVLLEPLYNVEIDVPEQYTGDIISDINTKRGRILGMEPAGNGRQIIRATLPLAEMGDYAISLRSIAQGRGRFTSEFSHYEDVPPHVAQQIVEQARKEREEHG